MTRNENFWFYGQGILVSYAVVVTGEWDENIKASLFYWSELLIIVPLMLTVDLMGVKTVVLKAIKAYHTL